MGCELARLSDNNRRVKFPDAKRRPDSLPLNPARRTRIRPGLAPLGLGIAVALWFTTLVVGGILDVVVDPEGRLGL
jgi:hypothetical protein